MSCMLRPKGIQIDSGDAEEEDEDEDETSGLGCDSLTDLEILANLTSNACQSATAASISSRRAWSGCSCTRSEHLEKNQKGEWK